jgi:hypothetical protein
MQIGEYTFYRRGRGSRRHLTDVTIPTYQVIAASDKEAVQG